MTSADRTGLGHRHNPPPLLAVLGPCAHPPTGSDADRAAWLVGFIEQVQEGDTGVDSWESSAAQEAATLVPLLVADAAHRLQLRLVGVPLIPVAKLAPLEHVLAPAVAGELVAHPSAEITE